MMGQMPTRQSQPYRKGVRHPSVALLAMLRGRPFFMPNPQDLSRAQHLMAAARRRQRM
jgi:hypothetical protein